MSSDTNIWETGVNDNGNGTDNNQYFISDTSDAEKRLTIQRGTGNIGVGTNEPSQLLDVSGNINLSGNIYLSNTGTIYKNGQEYAGGSEGSEGVTSTLWTENGTKIHYNAGNVGINTSDPTETLEVVGNIKATSLEGDGSGITNLDATKLTGIIDNARLPADISITGDMTAKNLNVTGSTTTINTDTYQTENLEIISTGADGPSLKITHDTVSHDVMQVIDASGTQSLTMTHDGKIGIGTNAPSAPLHIYDTSSTSNIFKASDTEITINRSIIPETNDTLDIGSAERKIRDMYISNNSLWLGDDHKLAITSDGTMKFRKRDKSVLPKVLRDALGTDADAIAHVNLKYGTSFANVSEFKLNHVLSYARTISSGYKTSDIFGDDAEDYEQDTAADAWQLNSSKIFLGSDYTNIGIGTNNPDPAFKLDVAGNVNTTGTISADDITIKGSVETGSGSIKLNCKDNSHGVIIEGPPHSAAATYKLTLPSTAPEASKVLSTDASGNLSWVDQGSSSASSIQNITTTASKVTIDTEMDVTNNVTVNGSEATGSGSIKLNCKDNSHGVAIKGPPHSASQSYTLTLPSTAPEASKVLSTDASGNLSWIDQASGGDGSSGGEVTSVTSNILVHKIIEPTTTPNITHEYVNGSQEYKIITFEYDSGDTNANDQTEYIFNAPEELDCDILVIAGGGGGGATDAAGGGAGGLIYETGVKLDGEYTIKVGNCGVGGAGGTNVGNNPGLKGKNSQIQGGHVLVNYDAVGGGGGGSGHPNNIEPNPAGGGSSGGLGSGDTSRDAANIHVDGQGYSGGTGGGTYGGGGGGGAGGIGGNANNYAGAGGIGREIDITGTATYYAGGGGGGFGKVGSTWTNVDGGLGGGGRGSATGNGLDATYYGGGGGGGGSGWGSGGDGYKGLVMIRYKIKKIFEDVTSLFQSQFYTMKEKPQITSGPVAQVTDSYVTGNDMYKYMMFTYDAANDNGSGQTEYALNFSEDTNADILIVGGGGGGGKSQGNGAGGGGGAGGLLYIENQDVTKDIEYIIKVGKGGDIQTTSADAGYSGEDSSFDSIIAVGGGGGAGHPSNDTRNGGKGFNGGSGGGAGHGGSAAGSGITGQGHSGGNPPSAGGADAAGGGGSGSPGGNAITSVGGGDGGDGTLINITGTNTYYAGGGGGSSESSDNPGSGMAGGGNGGGTDSDGSNASANTGSGGGGAGGNGNGGNGGSGVIIIRYLAKTLIQDIDTTLATKAGENIEWDTDNNKFTLTSNVAITSNLDVYNDINFMGNLYQNGELFVSGGGEVTNVTSNILVHKIIEPVNVPNVSSESIPNEGDYKLLAFQYDASNDNGSDQTEYTINIQDSTLLDILIIGAGGSGGSGTGTGTGGGGGGGGEVKLIESFQATSNTSYTIIVGKGGEGKLNQTYQNGNGNIGNNSSFDIHTALGGGGGGIRDKAASSSSTYTGGGEGGYGGGGNTGASGYDGGKNNNGNGESTDNGAGGGGGSGGVGQDGSGENGGDGGIGLDRIGDFIFAEKFGTTYGYLEGGTTWFGGGGGGGGAEDEGTNGYGKHGGTNANNTNGISENALWGGGSGGAIGDADTDIDGDGSNDIASGNGGSGIVIIRYKIKKIFEDVTSLFQPQFYTPIAEPSVANYGDVTTNLIAHYKFDSSGNLGSNSASTGYILDGTTYGNASINTTKGVFNNSSYYPGNAESRIKIDDDSNKLYPHLNQSAITISFWCWSLGTGGNSHGRLFYGGVNGSANNVNSFQCIHWGATVDGRSDFAQLTFIISNNGEDQTDNYMYTTQMPAFNTAWSHVALVLEPQSVNWTTKEHTVKIYVNGELDKTFTNMYMPTFGNGTTDTYDFNIGGWINSDTNYREYNGYIDDFRIYNKSLSATEIEKLYTTAYIDNQLVSNSDSYKYYMFKYDAENNNGNGQTEYALSFPENTEAEILLLDDNNYNYINYSNHNFYGNYTIKVGTYESSIEQSATNYVKTSVNGISHTLIYDFSSYVDLTAIQNYVSTIPNASINVDTYNHNGFYISGGSKGYFMMTMPSGYDKIKVEYSNSYAGGTADLHIGPVDNLVNVSSAGASSSNGTFNKNTYEGAYIVGETVKIDEATGVIGNDLKITFIKNNYNSITGISTNYNTNKVIVKYKTKTLTQNIDTTLATKAGENIEWDNTAKKYNLASDVTIANNLIVTGNIIQQYGMGTTESYLFLQSSAVFQNDDIELYENRKTSITLQGWSPDSQWQSFGLSNKIAEQLQNCFTYFLKGNRRDGNIHIITLNNSQTNATADRKYYAMRISSTQMKVWGSYDTTYPLAYSSALTWVFSSGATIYKTF